MSAGRKKADSLDRYDTPAAVTRAFLEAWRPFKNRKPRFVVEPAAGSGRIVDQLKAKWPSASIVGFDIEPRRDDIIEFDWLSLRQRPEAANAPDVIITNPPFRLAEQFLRESMSQVRQYGRVVLLLRAGFLESKRRNNLLDEFPPAEIYFLRSRPKFTGPNSDGATTDTAMYAWFVWRKGERPDHFEGRIL